MPAALPAPEWITATVPKRGNRAEENEDAMAASPNALRFAVADGATEGWESGAWAVRLVASYVERPPSPTRFTGWLAAARNWALPPADGPEPWYAAEKREEGSFATLAGLALRSSRRGGWAWRSVAVGDSCLLHIRGEELVLAVPLSATKEFGNRPALVPSSSTRPCPEPGWFAGRAEPGDLFLLATDAAAARLLDPPALTLALGAVRAARTAHEPAALAEWCRAVQDTNNDDVSVVAIFLPIASEPS
jgi:hypothetical protein